MACNLTVTTVPGNAVVVVKKAGTVQSSLTALAAGDYTYEVSAEDYQTAQGAFTIKASDETKTIKVTLLEDINVIKEDMPNYVTCSWVCRYIAACGAEVQQRFADAQARSGIEIPNTDTIIRSNQMELFLSVL